MISMGAAQEKLPASKIHGYADIHQAIEQFSYHEIDGKRLEAIHHCILEKGFRTIKIPKGTVLKEDFVVPSCLSEDIHARYFTPLQREEFAIEEQGRLYGIGVSVKMTEDGVGVLVEKVLAGGPAERDGRIKEGDIIIGAGENEKRITLFAGQERKIKIQEIVSMLRGPAGSPVTVRIKRGEEILTISLSRGEVKLPSVSARIVEPGIGYLRIESFGHRRLTYEEVEPELESFVAGNVQSLIIDLQHNPGGILDQAIETLKLFAPKEELVMLRIEGRGGKIYEPGDLITAEKGEYADWNIVVLIDDHSASASEVVAGVLQIWGTAVIGVTSHGKGSIQSRSPLSDGGAFQLTIGQYMFPDGKRIDGKGVTPDLVVEDPGLRLQKAVEYLRGWRDQEPHPYIR